MADETMMIELRRRTAACKGFRWLDGANGATEEGWDIRVGTNWGVSPDGLPATYIVDGDVFRDCRGMQREDFDGATPNLDDPATLGCLLALVREAWGRPTWTARFLPWLGHWAVEGSDTWGATEAEALVAALEAAP